MLSTFPACWKKITLFLTTLGHVWGVGLIDSTPSLARLGVGSGDYVWEVGLIDSRLGSRADRLGLVVWGLSKDM